MKINFPTVKLGIVISSRNNFSEKISRECAENIGKILKGSGMSYAICPILAEDESDISRILKFLDEKECNALAIILGNFGSEITETILAEKFNGPVMYAGVSEDNDSSMYDRRRDSYCGLLNCSYNLGIRKEEAFFPGKPIDTCENLAAEMCRFLDCARAVIGLKKLKIITFGPRPNDFVACNAPIKGLYDLGVEVQENSEMDLYLEYLKHRNDERIPSIVKSMKEELKCEKYAETLPAMAQYELTLLDWMEEKKGDRQYVAFANKCWPAFQQTYGFLPCYVHSRLAGCRIPVACETDIYGALSEYIGLCISQKPVTLMDVNNSIPKDLYEQVKAEGHCYGPDDIFMVFHCGNTNIEYLEEPELKYKMNRKDPYALETGKELTRGTLEGKLLTGGATMFRLHADPNGDLKAYVAEAEILPTKVSTYGNYGVFAVEEMGRFYRYVLLDGHFPHHAAIVFGKYGKAIFDVLDYLGVSSIGYNHPKCIPYARENPFH